jgi:hypothetical protein
MNGSTVNEDIHSGKIDHKFPADPFLRLRVTFFGAVLISSKPIAEEVRQSQFSYADALQQLEKQTNLSTREILDVNVNSMYSTRVLDEYETASLDAYVKQQLDRGEKVFASKNLISMPTTYIKLGGDIVRINIRRHDVFQVFRLRIAWFSCRSWSSPAPCWPSPPAGC